MITVGGAHQKILLNGKPTPDYATVQGIFIGVIAAFTLFMTIIGPECVFSSSLVDSPPARSGLLSCHVMTLSL
jgi:hypothetical protein